MTQDRVQIGRWILNGSLAVAIFVSAAKTIRVFLLNPRELGTPRGAAEDWLLLVVVLAAILWSSLHNGNVATIGRAGVVALFTGVAILFFQTFAESLLGLGSHNVDTDSTVKKESATSIALSATFFAAGFGVYRWAKWGRKLALAVSLIVLVGTVALAFEEGMSMKYVGAFAVLLTIGLWLFHPVVRRSFASAGMND